MNKYRPLLLAVALSGLVCGCRQTGIAQDTKTSAPQDPLHHPQTRSPIFLQGGDLLVAEGVDDTLSMKLYDFKGTSVVSLERLHTDAVDSVPGEGVLDTLVFQPPVKVASLRVCSQKGSSVWLPLGADGHVLSQQQAWRNEKSKLMRAGTAGRFDCPVDDGPEENDD